MLQIFKRLTFMMLLCGTVTAVFAQKETTQQRVDGQYRNAMDLFLKEKYATAQYCFDNIAREGAGVDARMKADAVYYAAVCSEVLGNEDAYFRLEEFLRLYPESGHVPMAYFFEGNCMYGKGKYKEALAKYQKLTLNDVEYGYRNEYSFKVGYCYLCTSNVDKAKQHFQHVIQGTNKYTNSALYYYAHIQYQQGQYDLALENFQKLERDPKFAKIVPSYVARIYYYLGREDDLLTMAPALLTSPDLFRKGELQQMVGEVYFNRGEYAQAIHYYTMARATYAEENSTPRSDTTLWQGSTEPKAGTIPVCRTNDNSYQMGFSYYMLQQYDSAAYYLSKKTACDDSVAQNALYTLADSYLRLGKKDEARSVFLKASEMPYDAKIKEDALFNYAKLCCELKKNPYNESIRSFEKYLSLYPKTAHRAEIEEILTSLYLTTRNYKDALVLIEKVNPKSAEMNQAYQRILINRGIELFNEQALKDASGYFRKAIKINVIPRLTTDAYYLYAESEYRQGNKAVANKALKKFFEGTNAQRSPYYPQALYTDAYLELEQSNYHAAATQLQHYVSATGDKEPAQQYDAYNRWGDCLYAQKHFDEAIGRYDMVIKANAKGADYATFQKAQCYGALGKYDQKLTYLNYIFEKYETSTVAPLALLEIANTYMVLDNNEMALLYYGNYLKQYPQHSQVKKALLDRGLILYNMGRDSLALECFDRLLTQYPGTDESRDALGTVRNIYVQQNRVDEYFAYVQKTTSTQVSTAEQDSLSYQVAANYYYEKDCDRAVSSFEHYLQRFPQGLFAQTAHVYVADCLYQMGQEERALPHYEHIAKQNRSQYTEVAIERMAKTYERKGAYAQAVAAYEELAVTGESSHVRTQALMGALRCRVQLGETQPIVAAARAVLADSNATQEYRDEATLSWARSLWNAGDTDSAAARYAALRESSNGEYRGEAWYYGAEALYQKGDFVGCEQAIEAIVASPSSDYWLAKSFILWSDIFMAEGNALQAKQTLQSIIDNYDGEELVNVARRKYAAIVEKELGGADEPAPEEETPEIILPDVR